MRVTGNMLVNNLKKDLSSNLKMLQKVQKQMTTGKKINKPSDDPIGLVDCIRLTSRLEENRLYQANVKDAKSLLNTTDEALGTLNNALSKVNELTIQSANSSMNEQDLLIIKDEIDQIIEEIKVIANTTFSDKYIFGGTNTTQPPYDGTTPWNDNDNPINYEISRGIVMPVNITAQEVFKEKELLETLQGISQHLEEGDLISLGGGDLGKLQENIEQVLACRSQVGARVNRLDLTMTRLEEQEINFETLLSDVQSVDIAEAVMNLQVQEDVYNSALAVGARIIQPSLIDFLR